MTKHPFPQRAIRRHCVDCCNDQPKEVPLCGNSIVHENHANQNDPVGYKDPRLATCPHCGADYNPDEVDIPFGDPLEGLCEDCYGSGLFIHRLAKIALKHLAMRWVNKPADAVFENIVAILTRLRVNPERGLALTSKWRTEINGGSE